MAENMLYAPTHRQDNIYHGFCFTNCGTRSAKVGFHCYSIYVFANFEVTLTRKVIPKCVVASGITESLFWEDQRGARPLSGGRGRLEDGIAIIFPHYIYYTQSKVKRGANVGPIV